MTKELAKSKPPTINSLFPGMLVFLRSDVAAVVSFVHDNGKPRKVLRSELGFVYELSGYKENLKHNSAVNALDIVQVYSLQNWSGEFYLGQFTLENRRLLWEENGYSIKRFVEYCEKENAKEIPFEEK